MKRGYDRTQRVGDLIQKALAQMLLQDMDDDRFRLVTITSVVVSRDLSYAKIYVSMLVDDKEKIQQTVTELNLLTKKLRYRLARTLDLRIAPELKFFYDESTARGFELSMLIDSAIKKEKKQ